MHNRPREMREGRWVAALSGVLIALAGCAAPPATSGPSSTLSANEPTASSAAASPKRTPEADLGTLVFGTSANAMSDLPWQIADEQGFFAEEGLKLKIVNMTANVQIAALGKGDVDVINSIGSGLQAIEKGQPFKAVLFILNAPGQVLVAKKGIKSVADLKGGSIGISSPGSAIERIVDIIVQNAGLNPATDVKKVSIGEPAARWTSLQQGVLQAALLAVPESLFAEEEGYPVLARGSEVLSQPQNGLLVTNKLLQEKPKVVLGTLRAYWRARQFMQSNKTETIDLIAKLLNINTALAERAFMTAGYDNTGKAVQEDLFNFVGKRDRPLSDFVDYTLLDQAIADVGWTSQ